MVLDPLTALGLAANVVQFLDYGSKILSKAFELYKEGSSAEHDHLNEITQSLKNMTLSFLSNLPSGRPTDHQKGLADLATSCTRDAQELLDLIGELRVTGKHRVLKSIEKATRSNLQRDKIKALEKRLQNYRSELALQLIGMLRFVMIPQQ